MCSLAFQASSVGMSDGSAAPMSGKIRDCRGRCGGGADRPEGCPALLAMRRKADRLALGLVPAFRAHAVESRA